MFFHSMLPKLKTDMLQVFHWKGAENETVVQTLS